MLATALACADQGSFTNSGGSTSVSSGVTISSSVASPAGTLTISCPSSAAGGCVGGSFAYLSADGTSAISATFTSGTFAETCAGGGGGTGGDTVCIYILTGYFSGTLTLNGSTQAITGVTYQGFGTGGAPAQGTTGYSSAYAPFYFSNGVQILRSDDLLGTNLISYGTQGSDMGQFNGVSGIVLDSAGRIYVTDTSNARIVRMDDMNGTNWTTFGASGSGPGQFLSPAGISIDALGRIYVMDSGNNQLVRMDDMTGANWITFSGIPGVGQFGQYVAPVAFDASGRIYVADAANQQIVRMDDMLGTNWTTLTTSPAINNAVYSLQSPIGVAVDTTGEIYILDQEPTRPAVIRVDDMTGTNWTSLGLNANSTPHNIAVDATGRVLVGGGGAQIVSNMTTVLSSSSALTQPYGPYYVFGATPQPFPVPSPPPSAISFSPLTLNFTQNVGTTSSSQSITITNFGGSPLTSLSISASGGFGETNNCQPPLAGGSTCTVSVTFTPSVTGPATGSLTVSDNSFNLGPTQTITLTGTGTAPVVSIAPTLSFSSQALSTTSAAKAVTVQNVGTGSLQVSGVMASGPFTQTNNCNGSIAPNASCTILVTFAPTVLGLASGTLTIADNAGTQLVGLTGTGGAPVTLSASSLSFGTVPVGNTSAAKIVTLTNLENVVVNFSSIVASAGFGLASNTCGTSVAAGTACSVGVTFSPTANGAAAGTLTFTDSALTSPQTVSLTGTGGTPMTLSATSLSFGTVAEGNTSAAKTVTLTNNQNVTLNFSGIVASGVFAIASNTCGTSIAAATSCTIGVTFSPTAIGAATGTLTFTDSALTGTQTASLTGTGGAPVTLSATSLSFGTVAEGNTSTAKTVTLTNSQNVALTFTSPVVASTGFAISSNTCGTSIAAAATCTVGVTFSPTAIGAATGTLTFADSALSSPQTVSLTGTGSAPVTLSASSLSLGTVTVGKTSAAKTVTLTNNEAVSLTFSGIVASAGFAIASNTCGASVAAGKSCTVGVTFTPTAKGAATGTLTFTDAAINSPQTVSLTGTGQ